MLSGSRRFNKRFVKPDMGAEILTTSQIKLIWGNSTVAFSNPSHYRFLKIIIK